MPAFGFPPTAPVPSLYRILRTLELTEATVTFDVRDSPAPADMLAEVQDLYPAATSAQVIAAAIIKQVDFQNTGYDSSYDAQTALVEVFEHDDGAAPPTPDPATARNILAPGASASYPSAMGRDRTTFKLRTTAVPSKSQLVNLIVWFDVPGLGS